MEHTSMFSENNGVKVEIGSRKITENYSAIKLYNSKQHIGQKKS